MSKHKHYDVIVAWAEGKPIQYFDRSAQEWRDWTLRHSPSFMDATDYRVKPEPRTIWTIEWWAGGQVHITADTPKRRDDAINQLTRAGITDYKVTMFREVLPDA